MNLTSNFHQVETGNKNLISPLLEKKGSCTHFLYWGGGGKNPQKVAEKSGLHVVPLRLVGLSVSGAEKTATLLSRIIMGRCALALPLIICAPGYSASAYVITESRWIHTILWLRLVDFLRPVRCAEACRCQTNTHSEFVLQLLPVFK